MLASASNNGNIGAIALVAACRASGPVSVGGWPLPRCARNRIRSGRDALLNTKAPANRPLTAQYSTERSHRVAIVADHKHCFGTHCQLYESFQQALGKAGLAGTECSSGC